MSYDWIYQLKPLYEDLKYGGKDWWRLQWKPIKHGTYNFWIEKTTRHWHGHLIGIRFFNQGAHNGWGRYWDRFDFEIGLGLFTIHLWVIWNIMVMKDGKEQKNEQSTCISCV